MNTIIEKLKFRLKALTRQHPEKEYVKKSYAQNGEDLIIDFIFTIKKISKPTYLDIGAFHPFRFSNTAIFYKRGARGVNVEPNPDGYKLFCKYRPQDANVCCGISEENSVLTYYKMNAPALNTFDAASVAELVKKYNYTIVDELRVPVITVKELLEKYTAGRFPDFLSLDVEGLDMVILNQIDYEQDYPKVICVETVEYTTDATGGKNTALINYILSKGYFIFADTNINTIFIKNEFWSN